VITEPIGPGQDLGVGIWLGGQPHPLGITAWTVTASVTEWSPTLAAPWSGAARFLTDRVQFDQAQTQPVGVNFSMEWGSPLPVAVMMTIGHT
jgi:hypothetical protein